MTKRDNTIVQIAVAAAFVFYVFAIWYLKL